MLSSELRANARKSLEGKWGKAALLTLVYVLIMFVIGFVLGFLSFIGQIASFVISVPISYGFVVTFMKLKRGEDVEYTTFLSEGFANFKKVWGVYGHTLLKLIIPAVMVVVFAIIFSFSSISLVTSQILSGSSSITTSFSGLSSIALIGYIASIVYATVKGYLYVLTNYILYDNPNMSSKEIVEESERLMRGNRWKFVWLGLTFIGWAILSVFTFYIGLLWLIPYISISTIFFYEALSGKGSKKEVVVETENNESVEG